MLDVNYTFTDYWTKTFCTEPSRDRKKRY